MSSVPATPAIGRVLPPRPVQPENTRKFPRIPSTHLKAAIVGLPNSGKTCLFNVLTGKHMPADNQPFSTRCASHGRVKLPDKRMDWLVEHFKPKQKQATYLTVTDTPALVDGSTRGHGLGDEYAKTAKRSDIIIAVVRMFGGQAVTHINETVNPLRDMHIITQELIASDIVTIRSEYLSLKSLVEGRQGGSQAVVEFRSLTKILEYLTDTHQPIRDSTNWTDQDIALIQRHQLLSAKAMICVVNLSERQYHSSSDCCPTSVFPTQNQSSMTADLASLGSSHAPSFQSIVHSTTAFVDVLDPLAIESRAAVLPFSAIFEYKLRDIQKDGGSSALERYFEVNPWHHSAIDTIIHQVYKTLDLIQFFTCSEFEVRAWTADRGTSAPQAAGLIHQDFERDFISVEVENFLDLQELMDEQKVVSEGKLTQQGKKYSIQDGDICFFKFKLPNFRRVVV